MDGLSVDCDLFDDGTANTTCVPPPPPSGLQGALTATAGRFNYNLTLGLPGANAACNSSFPGTHACTYAELQTAEAAGELVGLKDTANNTVTAFWAIDNSAPALQQCQDDTPGTGSLLNWEYPTAHTASRGREGDSEQRRPAPSARCRRACSATSRRPGWAAAAELRGVAGTQVPATPTLAPRRRPLPPRVAWLRVARFRGAGAAVLDAGQRLVRRATLPRHRSRRASSASASASRSTSTATGMPTSPPARASSSSRVRIQNGTAAVWSGANGALIRAWDGDMAGRALRPLGAAGARPLRRRPRRPDHRRAARARRRVACGASWWRAHRRPVARSGGARSREREPRLGSGARRRPERRRPASISSSARPSEATGRVYLLSGKDGTVLRTYAPPEDGGSFGWYVAELDDLDGDGRARSRGRRALRARTRAGAHGRRARGSSRRRAARSCTTGRDTDRRGGFGGVVAAVGDLDGDGKGEIAVAAPGDGGPDANASRRGARLLRRHRQGAPALVGHASPASCSDAWSSTPATSTATASTTSRSARRGIAAAPPTASAASSSAPGGPARCSASSSATGATAGSDGTSAARPIPTGAAGPALLIGSLRHPVDGKLGVGVLDLYVLRARAKAAPRSGHDHARRPPQRHQVDAQRAAIRRSGSARTPRARRRPRRRGRRSRSRSSARGRRAGTAPSRRRPRAAASDSRSSATPRCTCWAAFAVPMSWRFRSLNSHTG